VNHQMPTQANADLNLFWGSLILDELVRLGVQHVCMAPGSRSTPLTLAVVAQAGLTQHRHFDERGLGFFALGLAKASRAPVALIVPSGTAVANLYPAIIEAWAGRVPLVVLSADCPPELLGCGVNQAIVQAGIFASYARTLNLPTPDLAIKPQALLSAIDELFAGGSGPVHINCMFREPLYPKALEAKPVFPGYLEGIEGWQQHRRPFNCYAQARLQSLPSLDAMRRFVHGKGVILVGALTPQEETEPLVELAHKLGWPLLTDAQSQLRQHAAVVGNIDQLLLQPRARALLLQADRILRLGGHLVSKRLQAYIDSQDWQSFWQWLPDTHRRDPGHNEKQLWLGDVADLTALPWPASSEAGWARQLQQTNLSLDELWQRHIDQGQFGEAQVIRAIAADAGRLFLEQGTPLHLYDMFAPQGGNVDIHSNSDKVCALATACGLVAHDGKSTSVILGELAVLQDLNSLALARQLTRTLVIVVLNTDAGQESPSHSAGSASGDLTHPKHELTLGYGAAMFGLHYGAVDNLWDLVELYQDALAYAGASVIEVNVGRGRASEQTAALGLWVSQG
jgi:2-succinyl-5-enolpyruvyl-6-hydroxy-3-cyclohexene-1-carboxylate synthase